jgi:hypothetical protein
VPLFVIKSALFVQANVAVNTKLKSKVPFLFGNFDLFQNNLVKNVQFRYGMKGKFSSPSPISWKNFLGALFNIQNCPWKLVPPPQSFDASYAPATLYLHHISNKPIKITDSLFYLFA